MTAEAHDAPGHRQRFPPASNVISFESARPGRELSAFGGRQRLVGPPQARPSVDDMYSFSERRRLATDDAAQQTDLFERPLLVAQHLDVLARNVAAELVLSRSLAFGESITVNTAIDDDFRHYAQPVASGELAPQPPVLGERQRSVPADLLKGRSFDESGAVRRVCRETEPPSEDAGLHGHPP